MDLKELPGSYIKAQSQGNILSWVSVVSTGSVDNKLPSRALMENSVTELLGTFHPFSVTHFCTGKIFLFYLCLSEL